MLRRKSYLTFPKQKDANARFYTRVGTPKYLITKPIENQVNIVTTLVTRIRTWKSRNQWKVLFLCLVLYTDFRSIILFKHGMLSFVVCEFFMLTCLREYIYWTMQRNDNFSFTLLLSKQLFHRMSVNTSGPLQTWRIRVPKYDFTKTVTKSTQKRSPWKFSVLRRSS